VLVEKRAAHPRALGDGGERNRRALRVRLAQRAAHALLGIERAPGGSIGEWAAGRLSGHRSRRV
jgi:hypothetical protein